MKLFASDYDGTYCKHTTLGKKQLKQNIKVTKQWQEKGNLFVFATGRAISLMKPEELLHGIQYDYIVGLNGAIIVSKDKEVLYRKTMESKVAEQLIQLIKEKQIEEYMITDGINGHAYTPKRLNNKMFYLFKLLKYSQRIFTQSLNQALAGDVAQISVKTRSHQEAIAFADLVNERFGEKVTAFANSVHVDISAKGVSKATGVAEVARLNHIRQDDIYCIGDSFNDLPMIEAYHGFTMIEACDEIKQQAEQVFETVSEAIEFISK